MATQPNKEELAIIGRLYLHLKLAHGNVANLNRKMLRVIPDRVLARGIEANLDQATMSLEHITEALSKIISEAPKQEGRTPWKMGTPAQEDIFNSSKAPENTG